MLPSLGEGHYSVKVRRRQACPALTGVRAQVWRNLYYSGSPLDLLQSGFGSFSSTMYHKEHKLTSKWECFYSPSSSFSDSFTLAMPSDDSIVLNVDEIQVASCAASCQTSSYTFTSNTTYKISASYTHSTASSEPGFSIAFATQGAFTCKAYLSCFSQLQFFIVSLTC
jgi:hypothetical protein